MVRLVFLSNSPTTKGKKKRTLPKTHSTLFLIISKAFWWCSATLLPFDLRVLLFGGRRDIGLNRNAAREKNI